MTCCKSEDDDDDEGTGGLGEVGEVGGHAISGKTF